VCVCVCGCVCVCVCECMSLQFNGRFTLHGRCELAIRACEVCKTVCHVADVI